IAGAERGRLREELQSQLFAIRATFNEEISKSCFALMPSTAQVEREGREAAYAAQYARWKETHDRIFRRMALAVPAEGNLHLLNLDLDTARYSPAEWPAEWSSLREYLSERLRGAPMPPFS